MIIKINNIFEEHTKKPKKMTPQKGFEKKRVFKYYFKWDKDDGGRICVPRSHVVLRRHQYGSPTGPAAQSDKPRFLPPLDPIPGSRRLFPFPTGLGGRRWHTRTIGDCDLQLSPPHCNLLLSRRSLLLGRKYPPHYIYAVVFT